MLENVRLEIAKESEFELSDSGMHELENWSFLSIQIVGHECKAVKLLLGAIQK